MQHTINQGVAPEEKRGRMAPPQVEQPPEQPADSAFVPLCLLALALRCLAAEESGYFQRLIQAGRLHASRHASRHAPRAIERLAREQGRIPPRGEVAQLPKHAADPLVIPCEDLELPQQPIDLEPVALL